MKLNKITCFGVCIVLLLLVCYKSHNSFVKRSQFEPVVPKVIFRENTLNRSSGTLRIPRIIHQTWKQGSEIPLLFKNWIHSWTQKNNEFEYWFWDDEDIKKLVEKNYPAYLDLFLSYPTAGYKADAFRYFVLYEHGGLYADLDAECLQPLLPITKEFSCIISQEPLEHAHFLGPLGIPLVSNAIMACEPKHPFFGYVINSLYSYTGWLQWADILHATGPYMLTRVYRKYSNFAPSTLPYLAAPEVFQPTIDNSMLERIREMCMHGGKVSFFAKFLPGKAVDEMYVQLCRNLMGFDFNNSPKSSSYTDHHWTHTWATKIHDPWGVKNWRMFFNILDLKPKN